MNYGLHLSASGVLTNLYRQDVYANNIPCLNLSVNFMSSSEGSGSPEG